MTITDIQTQNIKQIVSKTSKSSKAFGILNGKIKDPVAWQRAIGEKSDRDITQKSIREQAWK